MKLISVIKKENLKKSNEDKKTDLNTSKHFPSSVREWDNSIFTYNTNSLALIPHLSKLATKFIKSYFSLYDRYLERIIRTKKITRKIRKYSSSRIFISKGEFKHTNNKVTITLYTYNRQKTNYLLKLKKRFIKKFLRKGYKKNSFNKKPIYKKIRIRNKILLNNKLKNIIHKSTIALLKATENQKDILKILNGLNKKKVKNYYNYIGLFYKRRMTRFLRKIVIYIYYKQLIYINKSKFNYTYLQYLKNYLQVLFDKNVEFNFINLKHFHLNSNILSESLLLKITKNKGKLTRDLNILRDKLKVNKKVSAPGLGEFIKKNNERKSLQEYIINNLKYKNFFGFRLQAKGRLSKRFTASRSVSKLRYQGNLINIDSSYFGLSSVLLKGNLKSNVQFTKLNSKSRLGSFGIKGWVNGY